MRISDWSSDVCSADLAQHRARRRGALSLRQASLHKQRKVARAVTARKLLMLMLMLPSSRMEKIKSSSLRSPPSSGRSEEHTSELQSLMRISYAVFCLKKKNRKTQTQNLAHNLIQKK